jgi:hypothetical protein
MQEELVHALAARRPQICARWAALLHIERANSALAHPDALVHLMDWCFTGVLQSLGAQSSGKHHPSTRASIQRPACPCGRNPYLYFFVAGEQAFLEALVLSQAELPKLDPIARDQAVAELFSSIRTLGRNEVEAFCSVCQYQHDPAAAKLAHSH